MSSVEKMSGVGPKALVYLEKLGIETTNDLLEHYPFRYDFLVKSDLLEAEQDSRVVVEGIIEGHPVLLRFKGNMNKITLRLNAGNVVANVGIFNRAFLKNSLENGKKITVIGKWDKKNNQIVASDIRLFGLKGNETIEPVYHTTSGLSKKTLTKYINTAISTYLEEVVDYVPDYLKEKYNLLRKDMAIRFIHHPSSKADIKKASVRLKYEELFMFMLKINYLKYCLSTNNDGLYKDYNEEKITEFVNNLPFELTEDQKVVNSEILADMKSKRKMNRLLQGDVGSGKTVVSVVAIYANYLSGFQSALMAPTEILATQHYENVKKLLKDADLKIVLLTGSTKKKEKDAIYEGLANGEIDLVIGTHALIQDTVVYKNLGLVITDEQHRFGVSQRTNLKNKGQSVDILYMSATPIPRTYALTIYGDMDISTIKTLPAGRKKITTMVKTTEEMQDVLAKMKDEIDRGHQIFVVAPLIEESEKSDFENIYNLERKMEKALGKVAKIGLLHGKMKQKEKDEIMNDFIEGKTQILISTTVIEVGIDIKNATMMVIFDAHRFGLSTLHQLRGRVGRSEKKSTCILISDKEKDRLNTLVETQDGFEISEADFKLRGQGDLFGVKQSGDMDFKIANVRHDFKILLQAKKDSLLFLKDHINDIKHRHIKKELLEMLSIQSNNRC